MEKLLGGPWFHNGVTYDCITGFSARGELPPGIRTLFLPSKILPAKIDENLEV